MSHDLDIISARRVTFDYETLDGSCGRDEALLAALCWCNSIGAKDL